MICNAVSSSEILLLILFKSAFVFVLGSGVMKVIMDRL